MNNDYLNTASETKTNFLYSFTFLSQEKSEAIKIIYAFCRVTDDIVDNAQDTIENKLRNIKEWRKEFRNALEGKSDNVLLKQVTDVISKFSIPEILFFDLIDGMEQDLSKFRYKDFTSLEEYCYKSAVTVGLMSIEIFGYKTNYAKIYAYDLGMAMQLTNIIRDIKTDAMNGRIYIPEDELKKFNYTEDDLMNFKYNKEFKELMRFECDRAKQYYLKADKNFHVEDKKLLFPARIMQKIYYNILRRIEKIDYNVFRTKAGVSKFKKIFLALATYFRYNFAR